jgi:hypothetical protein
VYSEHTDIMARIRLRLSDMDTVRFNTRELKITYVSLDHESSLVVDDLDDMLQGA